MRARSPHAGHVLHEIGYWLESTGERAPVDPTRLVNAAWASADRGRLVSYLRQGRPIFSYMGTSFCRFSCGVPRAEMGSADLSDGTWIWPEGLAHYVEKHAIELPDEFLEHARAAGFHVSPEAMRAIANLEDPSLRREPGRWVAWARMKGAMA